MVVEAGSEPHSPSVSSDMHGCPQAHAPSGCIIYPLHAGEAKPVLSSRWAPEPEVAVGYVVKTTAHQSALCLAEGWVQNGAGCMHLVSL